ncbi:helix-turn-helix transcriptional regulator [Spirillospora sp. NPDC029432]|uniref:helix-turn-helix domain-containing protein n=1 Tax=Spirillospora sp. NPDC029432 TaxID=3154599 RepID=UPI00345548E8
MPEDPPSSARLRRIGRALRQVREDSGYTLQAAGRRLERSGSSLSLIENGLQSLRLRDLGFILDAYGVDANLHKALMTLAEQEHRSGWWCAFKDIASRSDCDYASLERDASALDAIETGFIPGLLQIEDYALAIMRAHVPEIPPERADRFVAFRMARQRILDQPDPPKIRLVLDEAALRRARGGPAVMRAQLQRLVNESERERLSIQVLPFASTADPGVNESFWLLDIGDPSVLSTVLITYLTGRLMLDDSTSVERYRNAFRRIRMAALSETRSRDLIQRIMSDA